MKIRKVYASEAAIRSCSMKKAFLKKKSKNLQENTCAGVSALRNTAQKGGFPLRITLVNVIKSAVSCGFGHIY